MRLSSQLVITALAIWMASIPSISRAEGFCDEPDDPGYAERMLQTRAAVEAEDFELALEHLLWAADHFDFAIIDFSLGRSYHRLERYREAADAYTRFLRHFEGCRDEQGLADAARQYRTVALQEYTVALAAEAEAQTLAVESTEEQPPREDPQLDREERLHDEGDEVEVAEAPPAEVEVNPAGTDPQPAEDRIHPAWWIMASGGALMASGLVIELANLDLLERREDAVSSHPGAVPELNERVSRARTAERVLVSIGAATAIGGLVYLLVDDRGPEADDVPTVTISPRQTGLFLQLSGRF